MLGAMYYSIISQMKKQLGQLDTWLGKATAYAEAKKFDPSVFVGLRLAPDQFAFVRQVQAACDTPKIAAARLTGKAAPSHPDTEQTIAELRDRVASTLAYLNTLTEADFANAASASITQPRWNGKTMTGADYFLEHVIPNFYFHLTTAYAILRHNGVEIGKRDFLGPLTQREPG